MSRFEHREPWLAAAVKGLVPIFADQDLELPDVRVSVGFPGGRGPKTNVVGQCWSSKASEDGKHQIFVHPVVTEPRMILGIMIHELVHAIDDCASGHKGAFVKMIRALGVEGKPTCAIELSEELYESLVPLIDKLGEYPHAGLNPGTGPAGEPKKQSTRQLKAICEHDETYKVRLTRKMIDEFGLPICPCHGDPMIEAEV